MDIAKAFEILSQGKIISANSSAYSELSNMLLTDSFFNELGELLHQIGYRLIGENGYYYIAKRSRLTADEQQSFINKHQKSIVAIAFLRYIYPRLDGGTIISKIALSGEYHNLKLKDSTIKDQLAYLSWVKNKEDESSMIDEFFKYLEKQEINERIEVDNRDKFKVLDAMNYYISIVESIEITEG